MDVLRPDNKTTPHSPVISEPFSRLDFIMCNGNHHWQSERIYKTMMPSKSCLTYTQSRYVARLKKMNAVQAVSKTRSWLLKILGHYGFIRILYDMTMVKNIFICHRLFFYILFPLKSIIRPDFKKKKRSKSSLFFTILNP